MKFRKTELSLFLYWMNERWRIFQKKEAGEPWPWTKDEILQTYKFTNVFREDDRVTRELHKRIDPLQKKIQRPERLFEIILFRAFNWPPTYDLLRPKGVVKEWNTERAKKILHRTEDRGEKIFTGAYIISNGASTAPKIDVMCDALGVIWRGRRRIYDDMCADGTMEGCTKILAAYPMHGKFTSYEVVCDLRHQKNMLLDFIDTMTWANPGPGAKRGLSRLTTGGLGRKVLESVLVQEMMELMWIMKDLAQIPKERIEMREAEHSLCEFDKYCRVKNNEGRPRGKYRGG